MSVGRSRGTGLSGTVALGTLVAVLAGCTGGQPGHSGAPPLQGSPQLGTPASTSPGAPAATTLGVPAPTGTSAAPTPARTCTSVRRHEVTFTFDRSYACGTFANGDPWVAAGRSGHVGVLSISPGADGGRHGWMVNPASSSNQSYDSRGSGYQAALTPSLPYRARPDSSLVKAVSAPSGQKCRNSRGHLPCLRTAAVLTVLETVPADQGATVFRPPYFGTYKPLLSTKSIRTDRLPSLSPVAGAPSLDAVRDRYSRVQLDHKSSWNGRYLHPAENFRWPGREKISNYGSDLARDNNDAALRLMLDDSPAAKMPALINYLQAGIDWYGAGRGGVNYPADGGHNGGRKIAVAFAAVLLDSADMKAVAGRTDPGAYSENRHVYVSAKTGRALFGKACKDGMYEAVVAGGKGSRDCRDPLGYIDGGEKPGAAYQKCCTAKAYKASSLAARLLPGGKAVWNADHFHDYVDRWVTHGAWTSPDPRKRFLGLHGTNADSGHYGSSFQAEMWRAHAHRAGVRSGGTR